MIIYISGPMTGLPSLNVDEFDRVEAELRADGHVTFNPARSTICGNSRLMPRKFHIRRDIHDLLQADAIYMLDNWETSKGATLEHAIAHELKLTILFDRDRRR